MYKLIPILVVCLSASVAMAQQTFSCNYGARGACLGYGDRVVDESSVCFSSTTCNYKGYICKSKFDEVIDKNKNLVESIQSCIDTGRKLVNENSELESTISRLKSENGDLETKLRRMKYELESKEEELRAMTSRARAAESRSR